MKKRERILDLKSKRKFFRFGRMSRMIIGREKSIMNVEKYPREIYILSHEYANSQMFRRVDDDEIELYKYRQLDIIV